MLLVTQTTLHHFSTLCGFADTVPSSIIGTCCENKYKKNKRRWKRLEINPHFGKVTLSHTEKNNEFKYIYSEKQISFKRRITFNTINNTLGSYYKFSATEIEVPHSNCTFLSWLECERAFKLQSTTSWLTVVQIWGDTEAKYP